MKHQNNWRQTLATTISFSFALPIFLTSTATANPVDLNHSQFPIQENSLEPQLESQIVQAPNTCYQVVAEHGMYVREEPTVYSEAIAILYLGQNVSIVPDATQYWVPISTPIQGYVWADWLAPCSI